MAEKKREVITFYSFKGGTGRSMALANIGVLLAKSGFRTLMIDWDIEAPGLNRYFKDKVLNAERDISQHQGLIEFFLKIQDFLAGKNRLGSKECRELLSAEIENDFYSDYIMQTTVEDLYLLSAGAQTGEYAYRMRQVLWKDLFDTAENIFFHFTDILSENFDYILIDSRTGYADTSGICTMLLPEKLVLVFSPNSQSLDGVLELAKKSVAHRRSSDDLRPVIILPLPSRIENSEKQLREKWRTGNSRDDLGYQPAFEALIEEIYQIDRINLNRYFNDVQVQHEPKYAYGEEIASLIEMPGDRLSLSESYRKFLRYLTSDEPVWSVEDKKQKRAYISCTGEYLGLANDLSAELAKAGIETRNSSNTPEEESSVIGIHKYLDEAVLFIAIISDDYLKSAESMIYLSILLETVLANRNKTVVLVLLNQSELPEKLKKYKSVSGYSKIAFPIAQQIIKEREQEEFVIDELVLHSKKYSEIKLTPFATDVRTPLLFTGKAAKSLHALGSFGYLQFHEAKTTSNTVFYLNFSCHDDFDLHIRADVRFFGFCFCLHESLALHLKGEQSQLVETSLPVILSMTHWDLNLEFKKYNQYTLFMIQLKVDNLGSIFDAKNIQKKLAAITAKNTAIEPIHYASLSVFRETSEVIQTILTCDLSGTLMSMHLDIKILELQWLTLSLKKEKSTATVDHSTVAKLRQAREYVIQHRASNFTLSDLAKTVDMSPSTLSKGFKQVFGNTVLGFLLEERMRRAMELLRTTDQNIFDIARLTGYKNISSFSSAFKSHFGYAPRHSNRQRQT